MQEKNIAVVATSELNELTILSTEGQTIDKTTKDPQNNSNAELVPLEGQGDRRSDRIKCSLKLID